MDMRMWLAVLLRSLFGCQHFDLPTPLYVDPGVRSRYRSFINLKQEAAENAQNNNKVLGKVV